MLFGDILVEGNLEKIISSFQRLKYMCPTEWELRLSEKKANEEEEHKDKKQSPLFLMLDGAAYKDGGKYDFVIYEGIKNEIPLKIINSNPEKLVINSIVVAPPLYRRER